MFICFSSADRYTVVKSCLYHLKNYGFTVWYDYHELILGDKKREKNFENAIKSNKYFIIIYSKNLFNSPCAVEEEKLIFEQAKTRNVVIFPLLYNMKFEELPKIYQNKLENLIYNEIDDATGSISRNAKCNNSMDFPHPASPRRTICFSFMQSSNNVLFTYFVWQFSLLLP